MVIESFGLKKETHNVTSLEDLEELIINTMGTDIWDAIMYFHAKEIEELKENEVYVEEDIRSYDESLIALRSGVVEELDTIDKLIDKINEAKRLDRRSLINELNGIHKRLYNNEGY